MEHMVLSPPANETMRPGRSTAACPGALVAGGVVFLALTVAAFWYLFQRIDAGEATPDWGRLRWEYLALIFVVFLAPTPGGAGVAEGASLALMASVVPPGFAPYYHLFWRFSTAYLAALAGFICLGRAALDDAGRAVHDRRARRCP